MTAPRFDTRPFANALWAAGIALAGLAANAPARAASPAEVAQVTREACGEDPEAACLAALRKVCHRKMTMRCYLSRKARIDAVRERGDDPERIDERDDRAIFYDD